MGDDGLPKAMVELRDMADQYLAKGSIPPCGMVLMLRTGEALVVGNFDVATRSHEARGQLILALRRLHQRGMLDAVLLLVDAWVTTFSGPMVDLSDRVDPSLDPKGREAIMVCYLAPRGGHTIARIYARDAGGAVEAKPWVTLEPFGLLGGYDQIFAEPTDRSMLS